MYLQNVIVEKSDKDFSYSWLKGCVSQTETSNLIHDPQQLYYFATKFYEGEPVLEFIETLEKICVELRKLEKDTTEIDNATEETIVR